MFGARPNVVPIVVMTGVGPTGPQTVWYQQPDDSMIDPTLLALSPPATPGPRVTIDDNDANTTDVTTNGIAPPSPSPRSFGSNLSNTPQTPAPASSRAPKLSSASHLALAKAAAVKLVPQKRSVAEAMIDISQRTFDALERKNVMEQATAQRAQVLAEYQAGLLTKEEWLEEVQRIKKLFSPPSPPPAKRVRTHDEFVNEDA
ncbi:hypothetical protein FPV67DRAFT_1244729 [Lyophyllum atratum]|nr:hypothetical protein FPV67DRAFT_1244729 [Lyophyllum atratum]